MEALDLEGKDKFLGGLIKGKSDPYGVLQIGNQLFQSKTVKESLHPKWNEVYEVSASRHSSRSTTDLGVDWRRKHPESSTMPVAGRQGQPGRLRWRVVHSFTI